MTSWASSTEVPDGPGHELAATWPTATLSSASPVPSTTGATSPMVGALSRAYTVGSPVDGTPVGVAASPSPGTDTAPPAEPAGRPVPPPGGAHDRVRPAAERACCSRRTSAPPTRSECR